jgi:hypothetical protein
MVFSFPVVARVVLGAAQDRAPVRPQNVSHLPTCPNLTEANEVEAQGGGSRREARGGRDGVGVGGTRARANPGLM